MGVRIDMGLDADGDNGFGFEPSEAPGALEVPEALLERWSGERQAYHQAQVRWQEVLGEIEDFLYGYRRPQ